MGDRREAPWLGEAVSGDHGGERAALRRDLGGYGSQDTGLTACGSFGGRFCCIMALMEMGWS